MITIKNNTPVINYEIGEILISVKREEMCCVDGPPFSKVRGIVAHMKKMKEDGVTIVGYTETSISMAGWGVAWVGKELGMTVIIFDPQYKTTPNTLIYHRRKWLDHHAIVIPILAGRAKVNWYISRKRLENDYGPKAVLLPLGLPFEETIQETEAEVTRTLDKLPYEIKTFVINIGSGTIAAGLWRGVARRNQWSDIYGIMGRTGSKARKLRDIEKKAGLTATGLFGEKTKLILEDPGWQYTEHSTQSCPFPCNPFYDLKAWQWLVENIDKLEPPILFWNIGK